MGFTGRSDTRAWCFRSASNASDIGERSLGIWVALRGSELQKPQTLPNVRLDALAVVVDDAAVALSLGKSLVSC